MTKDAFLAALKSHLGGLPSKVCDDILADYREHFDEGMAHGRSEAEIAAAMGDPARLARELKAEQGLKRWDEERSFSAGASAVLAILSLGAIDVLILFPVLLAVISVLFAAACGAAGLVVAGFVFFFMAPFSSLFTGLLGGLMCALGFFSAGIALGSLTLLLSMGLINLLIRYGRFHVRLIKPVTA